MVEAQGASVLKTNLAAEGPGAGISQGRHFPPGLTVVLTQDTGQAGIMGFSFPGGDNPVASVVIFIHNPVNAGAVVDLLIGGIGTIKMREVGDLSYKECN